MRQRSTTEVKIFAFGLALGLAIAILMVGLIGWSIVRYGVTVAVDRDWVIEELATQSTLAMQAALPELLGKAKEQMPLTVKEQVKSGLGEMSLEIANYQVRLPAAVVSRIDGYMQSTVTAAFTELIKALEMTAVQALSTESIRQYAAGWAESLQGKRFDVEVLWKIMLPVTIKLR